MPLNMFERAHKFYSKGNIKKAEDCCKIAIANDAKDYQAYNLLGVMAIEAKKFGLAHNYLHKAVEVNNNYAIGYNSLGVLYKEHGLLKEAKESFLKAIRLEPNFPEANYNLGATFYKEKLYEQAFYYYNIAVQQKPDYSDAYNGMGCILHEYGRTSEAVKSYKMALHYNPEMLAVYNNLGPAILYSEGFVKWKEYLEWRFCSRKNFTPVESDVLSDLVIARWLAGEVQDCKNLMRQLENLLRSHKDAQSYKESYPQSYNQAIAYNGFLIRLIEWYEENNQNKNLFEHNGIISKIYFLGDSHSVTCANKVLKINAVGYKAENYFIKGCKVWFLVNDKENRYKYAMNRCLLSMEPNSIVVLNIGEIDCRQNEGIFKLFTHKNVFWKETTDSLIAEYLNKVLHVIQARGLRPMVWGIPAPHKNEVAKLPHNYQNEYISFIKYYNEKLSACCVKEKIGFVDNYEHTVDANGFSKENVKLDSFHLTPNVFIRAIQEGFLKFKEVLPAQGCVG